MPITYTTGTINQPDAGSVGLAMVERIRDDVAASVAWDLVDEFTVASGTVRWYVLRCLAAQSGLPADFHVVIGRTLSTGELRFAICEGYTPASFGGGLGQPDFKSWIPSGTSTKWWITVDNDGFTVAFNGPSNGWVHAGAYTPLTALPIDLPIQLSGNKGGQSDSWGNIVRNPGAANLTVVASALIQFGLSGTSGPDTTTILGFAGDLRYNDKIQGGQRPVSEVGMMIYNYATGDQAIYGRVLGKQKRVRAGSQVPAGIAFGDAYVLSGRLWVPYLPTDVRMWDTGVASS
jgi:hypothetical protein